MGKAYADKYVSKAGRILSINKRYEFNIANTNAIDSVVLLDTQGKEVLRLQRETVDPNAPLKTYQGSGANFFGWGAVARVLSDPQGKLKDVQIARDTNSDELIIYTVGPVKAPEGTVGAVLVGTYLKRELDAIHEVGRKTTS